MLTANYWLTAEVSCVRSVRLPSKLVNKRVTCSGDVGTSVDESIMSRVLLLEDVIGTKIGTAEVHPAP